MSVLFDHAQCVVDHIACLDHTADDKQLHISDLFNIATIGANMPLKNKRSSLFFFLLFRSCVDGVLTSKHFKK